jgi:hypothetical protein
MINVQIDNGCCIPEVSASDGNVSGVTAAGDNVPEDNAPVAKVSVVIVYIALIDSIINNKNIGLTE